MKCPYCQTRLDETAAECPSCELTLDRAAALLGPVPRLESGVSDNTNALTDGDRSRLRRQIKPIEQRFPQVSIQVTCLGLPEEHPFPLYAFWIFNLGGFSSAADKAGQNHNILLLLDPIAGRSSLTVGYGLEPFLPESALDHLLDLAQPSWTDGAWAEGISVVLDGLQPLLESAVQETGRAFDLPVTPDAIHGGEF